jgi:hypothetical protein
VECPRTRGSELRWRTGRTLPDAALESNVRSNLNISAPSLTYGARSANGRQPALHVINDEMTISSLDHMSPASPNGSDGLMRRPSGWSPEPDPSLRSQPRRGPLTATDKALAAAMATT